MTARLLSLTRALFRRLRSPAVVLPCLVAAVLLLGWDVSVRLAGTDLVPRPIDVLWGVAELAEQGKLGKYIVASLFRVTWGFFLGVLVGVPLGLLLGWSVWAFQAFNPLLQVLRPISPIAWIPLAILWFGVTDTAPIFLIFLASVFPITVSAAAAVKGVQRVHLRAARNFGVGRLELFRRVILPATLPQILTGLRIALGVAWIVIVAAEMLAVTSGLGYLILDARNQGKRTDLVVAGMVLIGLIGLALDGLMRLLERSQGVNWAHGTRGE